MDNLTLNALEKHWTANSIQFEQTYSPWVSVFSNLIEEMGEIISTLEGRRQLAENCTYLMLSKAINHFLSTYSLAKRGFVIDAALSVRNGIETLLLLQLCVLDPSQKLFHSWVNGKAFRPSWVRQELNKLEEVPVRDVIIRLVPDDIYVTAYKWLSDITHANLASLNHSVLKKDIGEFKVIVGGSIIEQEPIINAIFSVLCFTLQCTGVICASIFSLSYVEANKDKIAILQNRIDETTKKYLQSL
jgi:hypothetical protein